MQIDHERIHQNGWRQGRIFSIADTKQLLQTYKAQWQSPKLEPNSRARLVMASHSCDVVAQSGLEIRCDVIPAFPLPSDARIEMYGRGRDPRRLRLPIEVSGSAILHELIAPTRFAIDRNCLAELDPDATAAITEEELAGFELWLASRYRRREFPHAFDRRLGTNSHKRIRKALAKEADHIQHLLYSLSPQSELLDDSVDYQLRVVLLAKSSSLSDTSILGSLEKVKDRIEDILCDKPGIKAQVHLVGDEKMTYAQFHTFAQWGFEELSC